MGYRSQDDTETAGCNGKRAGLSFSHFAKRPCVRAPWASCSPFPLAYLLSGKMKMTEISVYHTVVSMDRRILGEFKYFSFFKKQPSWKCHALKSRWFRKDYFNHILSHRGDTLTLKTSFCHAASELCWQFCLCRVIPVLKWLRWTSNARLSLSKWLEVGVVKTTKVGL